MKVHHIVLSDEAQDTLERYAKAVERKADDVLESIVHDGITEIFGRSYQWDTK
jgi:uncharacterized phosphosugar-binding protein